MSDEDPTWVDVNLVFQAVRLIRYETTWSGTYLPVPIPSIDHPALDEAVARAVFLLRNLPRRYSEQLAIGAEAITRAVVEVQIADGNEDAPS